MTNASVTLDQTGIADAINDGAGRWDSARNKMFRRQKALEDGDLRGYAAQLGLDVAAFDRDRAGPAVADRIRRDVDSGLASGQVPDGGDQRPVRLLYPPQ
ncbi:MAG TPA: hypothetical protein VMA97_02800 [Streptosporangiaceae bacterium]|nr:hypothetical protein [Streptosporangiaceae bacterium]